MKGLKGSVLIALMLLASACATRPPAAARPAPPTIPAGTDPFATPAGHLVRVDQQGAVIVQVTQPNLSLASDKLVFEVALNTHSVDLGMDLAPLATLTADTGISVSAVSWDAPRGGRHVSGALSFPAGQNGKSILNGATRLTLTIRDLDVPARTFEWDRN